MARRVGWVINDEIARGDDAKAVHDFAVNLVNEGALGIGDDVSIVVWDDKTGQGRVYTVHCNEPVITLEQR